MRHQIERTATVAVASASLFAGAAFGMSQLDRADAAPSSAEAKQLKQLNTKVAEGNALLQAIAAEADKTNGNLYAICKNQESGIYQHYCGS